jgi:hypothetical protein
MAIGFESEEIHLYRLRERLRAMSDEVSITFGKQTRQLCGIRVSGTPEPVYDSVAGSTTGVEKTASKT